MELAGHDHFASLRTHIISSDNIIHNIFVAPSITAWYNNNPGVSSFKIDDDFKPHELRSTFLNLAPTIGHDQPLPFEQLEFRDVNYGELYKIKDLTVKSIWDFA